MVSASSLLSGCLEVGATPAEPQQPRTHAHRHLESLHAPVRDQAGALCRAYTSVDLPGASQAEAQRFISALGFKCVFAVRCRPRSKHAHSFEITGPNQTSFGKDLSIPAARPKSPSSKSTTPTTQNDRSCLKSTSSKLSTASQCLRPYRKVKLPPPAPTTNLSPSPPRSWRPGSASCKTSKLCSKDL